MCGGLRRRICFSGRTNEHVTGGFLSFVPMGVGVKTKNTAVQRPNRTPGDIVKEDCGAFAVFAERGSLASQMTAAKKSWM